MTLTIPTWAKAVAFALFVIVLIFAVTNDDPMPANGSTDPDSGLPQHEAWAACKDEVKAMLSNPGSADFSILSTTIDERADGYDIAGTLSASNDFGAEQEIAFSCDVAADGSVQAEVSGG